MEITIQTGQKVFIDKDDFDFVSRYKWYSYSHDIRSRFWDKDSRKRKTISLYRTIMNAPKGLEVDHINHNVFDNRKSNLRLCTTMENHRNTKRHNNNKSGYKGVSLSARGKYEARIRVNKIKLWLGYFKTKRDAAIAYNEAARFYFQEFALLNKI